MKNIKVVILLCLSSVMYASQITIQKYNGVTIAHSDKFKHSIILPKIQSSGSEVLIKDNSYQEIVEEDLPVELHSFSSLAVNDNNSGVNIKAVLNNDPILVAVIDTGIDMTNTDLQPYVYENINEIINGIDDDNNGYIDDLRGYNFYDDNNNVSDGLGHGTLISGMIAQNSQGNAKILVLKAFNNEGKSSQYLISNAIYYAVMQGAKIINCSFGYDYCTDMLNMALDYAIERDVVIVASAGNQGLEKLIYPASKSNIFAVSSLDYGDHLASFSNYGSYLALSSIGVDVSSTYLNNQYAKVSGTSISAGYVSGLFAFALKQFPNENINNIISRKARDITDPKGNGSYLPGWDKYTGYGKLDANSFSSTASSTPNIAVKVWSLLNYPNPIRNGSSTQFGYYLNANANVKIQAYNLYGRLIWDTSINAGSSGAVSGYNKVTFNVRDQSGLYLANDTYIVYVTAEKDGVKSSIKGLFTVLR